MKTFRFQVALFVMALIVCGCPLPAWATIRTVTSTADSGAGTLRTTIAASASGDTINFSVTGTITLTSGELAIGQSLNITGPGATSLTISGNNASRVLEVLSGATVNVSGLTIANGRTNGTASTPFVSGGGVLNSGALMLSNCVINNNLVVGYDNLGVGGTGSGGGIQNNGTLSMTGCTLSGNSADGGELSGTGMGGGIYNVGTLALTNCTLNGNFAVGANASPTSGNGGSGSGGGIWSSGANVSVVNCTISGDYSIGGLSNISGGGGPASGGGIYLGSGSLVMENTVVAGNGANPGSGGTASGPDVNGTVSSSGFNLIGQTNNSTGWVSSDLVGSTATPLSPGLGSLQNNGGPTPTMLLQPGSAAIDAGNSSGIITDQRGQSRPYDNPAVPNAVGGDGSDIGAVEDSQAEGSIFGTVVANLNDSGAGSLRYVIGFVSAVGPGLTITFASGLTGTITLTSGELAVGQNLNIVGPGATNLTVSGNNASRVLEVLSGAMVNVSGLTIANGQTNGNANVSNGSVSGGGILNSGTLTLNNCVVSNNSANAVYGANLYAGNGSGGGIQNNGTLAMIGCTLNGNSASSGVAFTGYGNEGAGKGGGINNAGTLALTNCTLNGNSASGTAGSQIYGGDGGNGAGGGIWSSGANVSLVNCTISGNSAAGGQGSHNSGHLAPGNGGSGSGGGVYVSSGSLVTENTIVAGNTVTAGLGAGSNGTATGPDVNGTVSSSGFNLIGQTNNSTGWVSSDLVGSTAAPLNPNLGSLQNNGGPTPTMALLAGSPAIDHGQTIPGLTTDQRGQPRPFGSGYDIGAYESQSAGIDIGLRIYDGVTTNHIAVESGTPTSKLRIYKNGTTYGILLVNTSDPNASKIRIQTSAGPMALQKLP